MTPEQLKASILQYAIQGKLVEQRLEEGTAEELYQQIQEEKQRLIKEGKIKKEKPLSEITDDEIPFDIPESWKWTRLNDIVLTVADIDHKMPESVEFGYPYISPLNFTSTGIDYENAKMIGKEDFEDLSKKCKPERGDIIFPRYGTIGVVRLVDTDRLFLVSYSCCTIKNLPELMLPEYVFYGLQSGLIKQEINRYINKTTQPNIGLQSIKKFLFPLPPLAEQKRIVEKIEELLPIVDRYAVAYEKLEKFNAKFPKDMKNSILQYAIQGKLVEQRADEGAGEELYKKIQAEKQDLINSGKIKKEKPLPEIAEDEIPFDIPENWKWVRLGDCTGYAQTKEKISPADITDDMWSLDLEDIEKDTGAILVQTRASERKITGEKVVFHKGQVLYSKLRPYLKKILVAPDDGICTPELVPFNTYLIDANYITYILRSPYVDYVINSVTYGVKMPRVGTDTMTNLLIPLPPLAEQKRIVAKIEELLPYCDKLVKEMEDRK